MKSFRSVLLLLLIPFLALTSYGFLPEDAQYRDGGYQYDNESQQWYFIFDDEPLWVVSLSTGEWTQEPIPGWSYFQFPYFYSFTNDDWYFVSTTEAPTVVNMTTGAFSVYGEGSPIPSIDLILVSGGTFEMQANESARQTTVSDFAISSREITGESWNSVVQWAVQNGYDIGEGASCTDQHPVSLVSWYDAVKWCNALSESTGRTPVYYTNASKTTVYRVGAADLSDLDVDWSADGFRLPTEAEWEFAARGAGFSQDTTYSGSNVLELVGWYILNTGDSVCLNVNGAGPMPVAEKNPNEIGSFDMSGNMAEWVWDWYAVDYLPPATNPKGPQTGSERVFRGGSWRWLEEFSSVTYRNSVEPGYVGDMIGFRVASSQAD